MYLIDGLRHYWLALLWLAVVVFAAWLLVEHLSLRRRTREVAASLLALPAPADELSAAGNPVLPDGRTLYLDLLGQVEVTGTGVRFRAEPAGAILGTWPQGLRLLWMGVHGQDENWWHVWNPADWSQVGWTHKSYLRGVA